MHPLHHRKDTEMYFLEYIKNEEVEERYNSYRIGDKK